MISTDNINYYCYTYNDDYCSYWQISSADALTTKLTFFLIIEIFMVLRILFMNLTNLLLLIHIQNFLFRTFMSSFDIHYFEEYLTYYIPSVRCSLASVEDRSYIVITLSGKQLCYLIDRPFKPLMLYVLNSITSDYPELLI